MAQNYMLLEAIEDANGVSVTDAVKSIKKLMQTASLTRFKSVDINSRFYSAFFLSTLEDMETPTVDQWASIYSQLLSDDKFCSDLGLFITMYQPPVYTGMFMPLWNLIQSELRSLTKNRVRYLSLQKAMLTMLQMRLNGVTNLVKAQVGDPNVNKFCMVIDQTTQKMIFDLNALIQSEIEKAVKSDDVVLSRFTSNSEETTNESTIVLAEDVQEIFDLCNRYDDIISESVQDIMLDEGLIGDGVERVKQANLARVKAENTFEQKIMQMVKRARENRRNRKHAEMVGEALRINRVIKRFLAAGAIGALNPIAGVLTWICSFFYDRATDKKDRAILVAQLRDEMEIVDEKINMADRQGDDKAKIELMRFKQKLNREHERIMHVRYDASARSNLRF